jgi:hypothetical protein
VNHLFGLTTAFKRLAEWRQHHLRVR